MADLKLRTAEELVLADYNYYIFFKIEPNEKDVEKIRNTINLERNKWTQGQPIQRRYKELYPDVENVMINDVGYDATKGTYSVSGARQKELDNAKKLKLNAALRLIVSMAENKGRIYKSELLQMVGAEKIQWFTLADLEAEVKALSSQGVKYIDDSQTVIDFRKYKEVEKYLVTAKKTSLYDAIGCTKASSVKEIADAKNKVYANLKNKTTPEGTAMDKLLGIVSIIFKTEDSKIKYDEYLAVKKDVWDQMELRQQHGIKEISLDEFLSYAEKMKAILGKNIDEVELLLAAGLKEYKIIVVGSEGAEGGALNLEICPYPECGRAYKQTPGIKTCPHCGKPLEILCWNCGGKMPYTTKNKTCPSCACTYQSKTMFDARIADIDKLVMLPLCNIMDLRSALTNLKNIVPTYAKQPNSLAYKKVNEYEGIINKKVQEEQTTGAKYKADDDKIRAQIALKNFQMASNLAQNLRRNYPTYNQQNTNTLISEINKYLTQAQAQVNQAKAYIAQRNENMVISTAAKALEICNDYIEAKQILQKYPPKAPLNIRVKMVGSNSAHIEWDIVPNQNLTTYTLIKKIGSRPTSPTDGTVVEANLTIGFYDDNNLVSATPYYYAVFASRCDVLSPLVVASTPVEIYNDVTNIRQEVVDGAVSVKWDVPHNVKAVEVYRKSGPIAPQGPNDGTKVSLKDKDGFVDTADGENSYLILCQYDVNGVKKYSNGIRRVFKKYALLNKLENVEIVPQAYGEFLIKCVQPSNGKLSAIYSKERLSCKVDTVLQMMDFNKLCKNAQKASVAYDSQNNTIFTLPQNQIFWVYPMVSNEQLFMLSSPVLLNTLAGIKNVSFSESNGTVHIKGILDQGIKNLIIKVSTTNFPTDINDNSDKIVVSKDQFQLEGGAFVKLKADTLSYISVFTEIEQNGKTTYTNAVPISDEPIGNLRKKLVYYTIAYTPSPKKDFSIDLKFSCDEEVELPRICIMKGIPRPLDKSSGTLVEKIEPIKLKKGFFSKTYTAKCSVKSHPDMINMKFIAFVDDDTKKHVQLREVKTL